MLPVPMPYPVVGERLNVLQNTDNCGTISLKIAQRGPPLTYLNEDEAGNLTEECDKPHRGRFQAQRRTETSL